MKILLTNDDGHSSKSIHDIRKKLEKNGHEVYLVAPKHNNSGVSMAISLSQGVSVQQISQHEYIVDGTPADCVIFAIERVFKDEQIDLVVSGVNLGANIGYETFYSGTVGAARIAHVHKINALAASYNSFVATESELEICSDYVVQMVESYFKNLNVLDYFLNMNIPAPAKPNLDFEFCKLGKRTYENQLQYGDSEHKNIINFTYSGTVIEDNEIGTDSNVILNGKIAISKLNGFHVMI